MKAYVYIANFGDRKAQHELVETLDEVAPAYTATVMHNGNVLVDCRVEDLATCSVCWHPTPRRLGSSTTSSSTGPNQRGLRPPPFQQGETHALPRLQHIIVHGDGITLDLMVKPEHRPR
jgi:hypothetical protein